jgi:hypothetical protein
MNDEQINAAIAEACGWVDCRVVQKATLGVCTPVAYGRPNKYGHDVVCPSFAIDLNAMHEVEKVLREKELLFEYAMHISHSHHYEHLLRATARERAEAFLKTLGKWEATTEESSAVQSTSSGGSGGASTYGGKGLGIAGATWPPETRITVNGKTFCLADIDKEMTE